MTAWPEIRPEACITPEKGHEELEGKDSDTILHETPRGGPLVEPWQAKLPAPQGGYFTLEDGGYMVRGSRWRKNGPGVRKALCAG